MRLFIPLLAATTLTLSACETTNLCQGSKEECGTGAGALLGGVAAAVIANNVDSDLAAGLLGTAAVLGGAAIGNQYGKYLDEQDTLKAQEASIAALNSRDGTASWASENNEGVNGTVKVTAVANSSSCKLADHVIQTPTGAQQVQTQFCQQEDGSWQAVKV